ncbi:MAG: thioredoxin domain-containing protein [Candidatus Falkowbacteria bacterium]
MDRWYKKWWGIGLLILATIFLALVFTALFYVSDIVKASLKDNRQENLEKINRLISGEEDANYWMGSADPKVTIVEFSDYSCPYCRDFFPKIREIGLKYKKDVKIIFRDYPVVNVYAANLALGARCAGEQGLFWLMHDKLFLNQGITGKEEILELAKQAGVNEGKFAHCFDNKTYLREIERDLSDGNALDISGTPTIFVNGERFSGNIPYDYLIQIINQKISE